MQNSEENRDYSSKFISDVVQGLPFSGIRKYFDFIAQAKDVISLGVGEPDYRTPEPIQEACRQALANGQTKYTSNSGMPELREAIADYLVSRFQLSYKSEEILVTVGVSEAVDLALRAIINPGDEVLIAEPCYVSYVPSTIIAGGVPVTVPTSAENEFCLRKEDVIARITDRTKAILLSYPNNPTGAIMGRSDLEDIARIACTYDLLVITDEVYAEMTYEDTHFSIAALPGMATRTILLNGFSKAFVMTGWRLGYAAGPSPIIEAMLKIHQYTMLCAPSISQYAAITALRDSRSFVEEMVSDYDGRRRFFVDGLRAIGLPCFEPKGAFYAFPSIQQTGMTSEEFCEHLLFEEKVAVVPGNVFGTSGEGFVRCCYAASRENLALALERIEHFLHKRCSISVASS